jgi:hypothetical protein
MYPSMLFRRKYHARLRFFRAFFRRSLTHCGIIAYNLRFFVRERIGEPALGVMMRILNICAGEKAIFQSLTTCYLTTYAL